MFHTVLTYSVQPRPPLLTPSPIKSFNLLSKFEPLSSSLAGSWPKTGGRFAGGYSLVNRSNPVVFFSRLDFTPETDGHFRRLSLLDRHQHYQTFPVCFPKKIITSTPNKIKLPLNNDQKTMYGSFSCRAVGKVVANILINGKVHYPEEEKDDEREQEPEEDDYDDDEDKWLFVERVYSILSIRLLIASLVYVIAKTISPISTFFSEYPLFLRCLLFSAIFSFVAMSYYLNEKIKDKKNAYFQLSSVAMNVYLGLYLATLNGRTVFASVVSTLAIASSLAAFTFCAVMNGRDLGRILCWCRHATNLTIIAFLLQIFNLGVIPAAISTKIDVVTFSSFILGANERLLLWGVKTKFHDEQLLASLLYIYIYLLLTKLLEIIKMLPF